VADEVGDGVRLAGAGRPLHDDAGVRAGQPQDPFLLLVGRQREEEPSSWSLRSLVALSAAVGSSVVRMARSGGGMTPWSSR
jgi:hypothetical protein